MNGQLISKPGENDTVYDGTPEPPNVYALLPLLPLGLVAVVIIIMYIASIPQGSFIAIFVVAMFVVYVALQIVSRRKRRLWFAKWRWYSANIDKVKTESTMSNYELALRGHPAPGLVVLRMSNRHELEFNDRAPFNVIGARNSLLYEARHINGELEFRNVQPRAS